MNIPPDVLWAATGAICTMILGWVISLFQKQERVKEETIESLKTQVGELVEVVRELRYAVKSLDEKVAIVPKLSSDITKAFSHIKDIKRQLPEGNL